MVVYGCAFPDFEAWTVVIQDDVLAIAHGSIQE